MDWKNRNRNVGLKDSLDDEDNHKLLAPEYTQQCLRPNGTRNNNHQVNLFWITAVRLQNLPWYKTGFVSRQVLHLLSKLQNWICPKTGQYETCIVSNTKIEASIRATKPKPWQSHLTSERIEIFIQNEKAGLLPMQSRFWCGRLSVGTKPVLVQQV